MSEAVLPQDRVAPCPFCKTNLRAARPGVQSCPKCRNPLLPLIADGSERLERWLPSQVGRWVLVRPVRRGGMGIVLEGSDMVDRRRVAVKFPAFDRAMSADDAVRFEREISLLEALDHPNLVKVLGHGTAAEQRFYAMEWVEGEDLEQVLKECKKRGGLLPFDLVIGWFLQLCDALGTLHARGIVHRDVKPSNVIVGADQRIKLIDLGIAKVLSGATTKATTVGTLGTWQYLAPELLEGDGAVDGRADIYSLGVMTYELLTGALPRGSVRNPSRLNWTIPEWFDDVLLKMMEQQVEDRIAACDILTNTLPGFLYPNSQTGTSLIKNDKVEPPESVAAPVTQATHEIYWESRDHQYTATLSVTFNTATGGSRRGVATDTITIRFCDAENQPARNLCGSPVYFSSVPSEVEADGTAMYAVSDLPEVDLFTRVPSLAVGGSGAEWLHLRTSVGSEVKCGEGDPQPFTISDWGVVDGHQAVQPRVGAAVSEVASGNQWFKADGLAIAVSSVANAFAVDAVVQLAGYYCGTGDYLLFALYDSVASFHSHQNPSIIWVHLWMFGISCIAIWIIRLPLLLLTWLPETAAITFLSLLGGVTPYALIVGLSLLADHNLPGWLSIVALGVNFLWIILLVWFALGPLLSLNLSQPLFWNNLPVRVSFFVLLLICGLCVAYYSSLWGVSDVQRRSRASLESDGSHAIASHTSEQPTAKAPIQVMQSVRQYYGDWNYYPQRNFYYRSYYFQSHVGGGYSYHYSIFYPAQPRYVYYYDPAKKYYWGRLDLRAKGNMKFSTLSMANRKEKLNDIAESSFPPPAEMPAIPDSKDGVRMEPIQQHDLPTAK